MPSKFRSKTYKRRKPVGRDEVVFWRGAFVVNGKRMYGVNTFLDEKVLVPIAAKERGSEPVEFCTNPSIAPVCKASIDGSKANTRLSSYHRSLEGVRKGKYIHSQIEKLIKKRAEKKALSGVKTKGVCVHPVAKSILSSLQKLNLEIHASEVGVFMRGKRLATRADMVCRNKQSRRFVIVELKTGYKDTRAYTRPKFRLRFNRKIVVSEQQRHFLQLLVTTILYNRRYPDRVIGDSILIQAPNHTTANVYSIPDWVLELRPEIERLIT